MPNGKRIALLNDCDNVSHNSIEGVLEELAKYGMVNNNSSFSSINYGYKKLGDLIKASELFDVDMRNNGTAMCIKDVRQ